MNPQSVLDPAGPAAASIHRLFDIMLPIATIVFLAVAAMLLRIILRRGPGSTDAPGRERKARRIIAGATIVTVLVLFAVLTTDLSVARGLARPPLPALTIRVTGHQWWWEVEYVDSIPQRRFLLANEIHVPVGQPVLLELVSHDVIHSFWAPNLAGKKDLIPGHDNRLWIQADRPGVYRAQCAEFCGAQHAKMALDVIAESPADFATWVLGQRRPPPVPTDSLAGRGRALVESGTCQACHTIASTMAAGRVGPDLTHVASRLSIAAGTLRTSAPNLYRWILDPQVIKPGAQMPPSGLPPGSIRAVVAYLETLR